VYRVTIDEQSQPQIDALPREALGPFAEARAVLEVVPWGGDSLNDDKPEAPVRSLAFGPIHQGLVTYLTWSVNAASTCSMCCGWTDSPLEPPWVRRRSCRRIADYLPERARRSPSTMVTARPVRVTRPPRTSTATVPPRADSCWPTTFLLPMPELEPLRPGDLLGATLLRSATTRVWLAWLDGEPVAVAAAHPHAGVTLVEYVATLPAARGSAQSDRP
jgi:hypothetical protein